MNFLDRINQLNDEIALLRSQLSDARKQLEADSATIAKLAKDKRELVSALEKIEDFSGRHHHCTIADLGGIATRALIFSRHA